METRFKVIFHLLQELTRKLDAIIHSITMLEIVLQMQALAVSLRVGFAMGGRGAEKQLTSMSRRNIT